MVLHDIYNKSVGYEKAGTRGTKENDVMHK